MKIDLTWKGGSAFEATTANGARVGVGGEGEPTPVETLASAVGVCTAMDVVAILQKMRQPLESYAVEVEWERGPEGVWPRPLTKIVVRHALKGEGIDPGAVERAVRLSDEKYCSVSATLRSAPEIVTEWSVAD